MSLSRVAALSRGFSFDAGCDPRQCHTFRRRNNPPEKEAGIRPLAVYNPIHYQELPELLMDYVCSFTGKSPSTTGREARELSPKAHSMR